TNVCSWRMPRHRAVTDVFAVFELNQLGCSDREIWEQTGVPIDTIRAWPNRALREPFAGRDHVVDDCPICRSRTGPTTSGGSSLTPSICSVSNGGSGRGITFQSPE